jgi:L-malate glycosyltransferase
MAIPDNQHIYMVYQTDLNPNGQGGGVRYVQELVAFLLKSGRTISFLGAGSFRGREHPNLSFYRMCPLDASWPVFFLGVSFFLLRNRSLPRGIFHVHRGYFAVPFLLLKPKVPIVSTLHGDTLLVLGGKSKVLRRLVTPFFCLVELLALKGIDRVIVVDERTAAKFIGRYPYAWLKNKMKIIPSAVDIERFSPGDRQAARQHFGFAPEAELVLFVGRLAKIKNISFLLRAFAKLERHRPQARLLLAGDGEERRALHEYAEKLGVTRLSFIGVVEHRDMPKLMQAADVLALCSHSEASPIVVKEAVACGLPVVTGDVGDVRQVITGKDLGTIAAYDESAFCQALVERLEARSIPGNTSQKTTIARNDIDFSSEKVQERIIRIYRELPIDQRRFWAHKTGRAD